MTVIENGGDRSDRLALSPGDEIIGFSVFKERILALVKELQSLKIEPWHPVGIMPVYVPGDFKKFLKLFLGFHTLNFYTHIFLLGRLMDVENPTRQLFSLRRRSGASWLCFPPPAAPKALVLARQMIPRSRINSQGVSLPYR